MVLASQGLNLALAVLHLPHLLNSGWKEAGAGVPGAVACTALKRIWHIETVKARFWPWLPGKGR